MIKLKALIFEDILGERKLDLSKKEDAAEHLIRAAWKFIPPGEDRYNSHQVVLWIDNESELSDLAWNLSQKFYPNDDDSWYKFQDDLERVLINMEEKRLEIRKRKNASLQDPLYILKKLVVGKNWNSAKRAISNMLGTGHSMSSPTDEEANAIFNRLYKNAMGETIYDMEAGTQHIGRLSSLEIKDDNTNFNQPQINIFIRHYGRNRKKIEGKVRVWRGTNSPHASIRPGDFVTFDRGYAQGYMSGKWKAIVTDVLDAKDLLVHKLDVGMSEMVYWPEGHKIKQYTGPVPSLREFWEQYRFGI